MTEAYARGLHTLASRSVLRGRGADPPSNPVRRVVRIESPFDHFATRFPP
ncbi:hypothetical protein C7S14_0689 [Burkholderia cepacia]|nr:hypothetical protein C7S14_0689 [Burkholderia cepacia]